MSIRSLTLSATLLLPLLAPLGANAAPRGVELPDLDDDVEVIEGVVTALSCARETQKTGDLTRLTACPMKEISTGIVVYSVTDRLIFRISEKAVYRWELESAFGGGSIDFEGTVTSLKGGIVLVDVEDYSVTPKPKAGSFKGCL